MPNYLPFECPCGKKFGTINERSRHQRNCKVFLMTNADEMRKAKEKQLRKPVWR